MKEVFPSSTSFAGPLMALFGRDAMSDLSPESAPKRTSANAVAPAKSGEMKWTPARLDESAP